MSQSSMIDNAMIRDIIIRAKKPSDKYRDEQRMFALTVCMVCTLGIGLTALACLAIRGCASDPVAAYSLCEQCGEIIGATDHGACQSAEVAYAR